MRNFSLRHLTGSSLLMILAVLVVGCGSKTESEQAEAKKKPGTLEEEVHAALDGAIEAFEKKDFKTLLEKYAPVEALQRARREEGGLDEAVKEMERGLKKNTDAYQEILTQMKNARKVTPTFDKDKTFATFKITVKHEASQLKLGEAPLLKEINPNPNVLGYGKDLNAALKQAIADLESGKISDFLAHMLPVSELKLNKIDDLTAKLKARPDVIKQMITDLKQMAKKGEPIMQENDTVALYNIDIVDAKTGNAVIIKKQPAYRPVKLQLTGGHWRLFDNTTPMQNAYKKNFEKLQPGSTQTSFFYMEKIGSDWRMADQRTSRRRSRRRSEYKTEYKTYSRSRSSKTFSSSGSRRDAKTDKKR
ncbi:MAG: hypothetical protein Tsb009_03350 [Planctomycetaceae bacterium]